LRRAHHHGGRWIARAHGAELVHRRGIVAVDEVQVRRPGRFGIALQEARRAPRGEAEDAGEQQPLRLAEADYVDEVVFAFGHGDVCSSGVNVAARGAAIGRRCEEFVRQCKLFAPLFTR
jgi:hypothetical protein